MLSLHIDISFILHLLSRIINILRNTIFDWSKQSKFTYQKSHVSSDTLLSKTERLSIGHSLMSILRNGFEIDAVSILKNRYNINTEEWVWVYAIPILKNGTECQY